MARRTYNPPHAQHPDVWRLGESGPEGVHSYLKWILDDTARFHSAAAHMRYLRIGMHFLTVAQKFNAAGDVVDKLELNFWSEEYPPEVGAGGHAHSRSPRLWSLIHPKARQTVSGLSLLPPTTLRLPGLPIKEGLLTMLNKVDPGDGQGTVYYPQILSKRLALEQLVMDLPPGTRQSFPSLFVHDVRFRGPGIGVTVQRQGPMEQEVLNTFDGFVNYKGLAGDEAAAVIDMRDEVSRRFTNAGSRLVASTVLFRDPSFTLDQLETTAQPVPIERTEHILTGGLHTQEILGAAA